MEQKFDLSRSLLSTSISVGPHLFEPLYNAGKRIIRVVVLCVMFIFVTFDTPISLSFSIPIHIYYLFLSIHIYFYLLLSIYYLCLSIYFYLSIYLSSAPKLPPRQSAGVLSVHRAGPEGLSRPHRLKGAAGDVTTIILIYLDI